MNEIYESWLKERPNYKPLRRWDSGFVKLVLERHPKTKDDPMGFIHRTIVGDPGYGKSTYGLKLMAKIDYVINGYTKIDEEEYSYRFAIDNMIYRPIDLFNKIDTQRKLREPAIIWCLDDASMHMGKQLFDNDRATYRKLQGYIPVIREHVTALLITTPIVTLLAKPLREFLRKKVEMKMAGEFSDFRRIGRHYNKKYYPDDIRFRMYVPFQDKFSCLIPQPFYDWYRDKKLDAIDDYLRNTDNKNITINEEDNDDIEYDEKG